MPGSVNQITNYTELQTALADWLDRSDLAVMLQSLPQLVEADINRKLRHHKMVCRAIAAGHAGDETVGLPEDWLEARLMKVDGCQVTYQSPDVIEMLKARAAVNPGELPPIPTHYTYYDSVIEIWPLQTVEFTVTLDYYGRIPALQTALNGVNWLITDSPDIYLYGCLQHTAPYLKDDPRIALWSGLYDSALAMLDSSSVNAMTSGSRITRIPAVSLG